MTRLSEVIAVVPEKKLPPHDLNAEKSVLGAVLIKPTALVDVSAILRVDDFFLPAHREIYDAMMEVNRRRGAVDVIGLADELQMRGMMARLEGREMYLLTLGNVVPTAENVLHYARIVRDKADMRRLIAQCMDTASRAHGDAQVAELAAEHGAAVRKVTGARGGGPSRLGDALDGVLKTVQDKQENPALYLVPTGLRGLDDVIGGHAAGDLVVVGGRPSRGKTSWMVNSSVRAASAGIPQLVFSLEMSGQQIFEKAVAMMTGIEGWQFARGKLSSKQWEQILALEKKIAGEDLPFYVEEASLSCEMLCDVAESWALRVDPDALAEDKKIRKAKTIWIDSMSFLRPDREGKKRAEDVGAMARSLKLLAKHLMVPICVLVHLNREMEKGGKPRRPGLHDLRESGDLEQSADVVIFPHREGNVRSTGPVDATMIVAKARNGQTADVPVLWDGPHMSFHDVAAEDPVQENLPGAG